MTPKDRDQCPSCNANLKGDSIWETFRNNGDSMEEVERLKQENAQAIKTIEGLTRLGETVIACADPGGRLDLRALQYRIEQAEDRAQAAESKVKELEAEIIQLKAFKVKYDALRRLEREWRSRK